MSDQTAPVKHPLLAAWHEQFCHASQNPFLLNLLLKQWQRILKRLAHFYVQLASLPRRNRRALQRALATSLVSTALLLAMSGVPAAYADTTITVDPGASGINDDGLCSLVEAIVNANDNAATYDDCAAGSGTDTITLPTAATLSYLTHYGGNHGGFSALPDVTSAIIIEADGSTIQRDVSAGSNFRLFYVSSPGDLTLNDATISGGTHVIAGGGIFNSGGKLTLDASTVSGNDAYITGGGIASPAGTVTIQNNSTISGNYSYAGGGVSAGGTGDMGIYDSTVTNNMAYVGGGIGISDAVVTLDNVEVTYNYAVLAGGGIVNYGTATITGSTISHNTAHVYDGGGIATRNGKLYLTDSTVSDNYAYNEGGGIKNDTEDGVALMIIHSSTISGNDGFFGGGIDTEDDSAKAYIYDSTISGQIYGGGIATEDYTTLGIYNTAVEGNYAYVYGGGITCYDSYLTIADSSIRDNTSKYDTGGIDSQYCDAGIRNTTVSGNTSTDDDTDGGGIEIDEGGFFLITNSTISNNRSTTGYGGIGLDEGAGLFLVNSTVTGNSTTEGNGGGLAVHRGSTAYMLRSIISGNSAGGYGSEVYDDGTRHKNHAQERAPGSRRTPAHTEQRSRPRTRRGTAGKPTGPKLGAAQRTTLARIGVRASDGSRPENSKSSWSDAKQNAPAGKRVQKQKHFLSGSAPELVLGGDYNLFGHSGIDNATAFHNFIPIGTDITATSDGSTPTALANILNPTLASNGGPTTPTGIVQTHALKLGSPAVDKAPNSQCDAASEFPDFGADGIDERHLPRNININNGDPDYLCDIGAFELQSPTAANVAGLHGLARAGKNLLKWRTTTESQIAGFNVYRKQAKKGWTQINAKFKAAKHAGAAQGTAYRFADKHIKTGKTYRYKIEIVYLDGHKEWTGVVKFKTP